MSGDGNKDKNRAMYIVKMSLTFTHSIGDGWLNNAAISLHIPKQKITTMSPFSGHGSV